jgi:hypothetical protein
LSGEISLSEHGREQASRRGLSDATVLEVAHTPEQRLAVRPGREIRQSRIAMPAGGRLYLVRVVVDTGPREDTVVTEHRTSRIDKY